MSLRLFFNLVAMCGAAGFAGAMAVVGVAFGGYWKSLPPAEFLLWFSAHSHPIGATMALFIAPTLVGVAGGLWTDWNAPPARILWLAALGALFGALAITAVFHLPTNAAFAAKTLPLEQVSPTLDRWLALHAAALALLALVWGLVVAAKLVLGWLAHALVFVILMASGVLLAFWLWKAVQPRRLPRPA